MEIKFLGTGEAFDPYLGSTSMLVSTDKEILLDCGFQAVGGYWRQHLESDYLDAVYLTHFHADHCFGLPAVLTRLHFDDVPRTKPLTIIGQPGIKSRVEKLWDLAYPGIRGRIDYELRYIETIEPTTFGDTSLQFALTEHSAKNYAIKIDYNGKKFAYSGDGAATAASLELYRDVELLIHECWGVEEAIPGHGTLRSLEKQVASLNELKLLACVHIKSDQRVAAEELIKSIDVGPSIIAPKPGDVISHDQEMGWKILNETVIAG